MYGYGWSTVRWIHNLSVVSGLLVQKVSSLGGSEHGKDSSMADYCERIYGQERCGLDVGKVIL